MEKIMEKVLAPRNLNKYEIRMIECAFTSQNILEQLKLGPQTRVQLVQSINKPRSTIFGRLEALTKKGLIEFEDEETGKVGRPRRFFKLISGGSQDV